LRFTETMRGYVHRDTVPPNDYHGAAEVGRRAGTAMRFTLTVATSFLDEFLEAPDHPTAAVGTIHVAGLTGPEGARVSNGVVNLLSPGDSPTQRRMVYTLPFFGADGRPYLLDGYKDVRDHGHFDVWGSTTTLYSLIRAGHAPSGQVLATGILHIQVPDFLRQLTTVRVTGTSNPLRQAEALARFERMFAGNLWDVFVRPRVPEFAK
jgi:cholesterol oxidase